MYCVIWGSLSAVGRGAESEPAGVADPERHHRRVGGFVFVLMRPEAGSGVELRPWTQLERDVR
jgi:hypothetical protein